MRETLAAISLAALVAVAACGGGEMTLNEYVEQLNTVLDNAAQKYNEHVAGPRGEVLAADAAQLSKFTPQDLQAALEAVLEIEIEVKEATDSALHLPSTLPISTTSCSISVSAFRSPRTLAARAGTATSWEELSDSPEMAAYRNQLASDKQRCIDLQGELDAIADRGVFADTPWLPAEMQEVVEALIQCEGFPDHPGDVYRPLPTPDA